MRLGTALLVTTVAVGLATAALVVVLLATVVLGDRGPGDARPFQPLFRDGRALSGDPVAGAAIFVSARCGSCHTLAVAGANGKLGPNLDLHLSGHTHPLGDMIEIIRDGRGAMPPMRGRLTPTEIRNVATFVLVAAGRRER